MLGTLCSWTAFLTTWPPMLSAQASELPLPHCSPKISQLDAPGTDHTSDWHQLQLKTWVLNFSASPCWSLELTMPLCLSLVPAATLLFGSLTCRTYPHSVPPLPGRPLRFRPHHTFSFHLWFAFTSLIAIIITQLLCIWWSVSPHWNVSPREQVYISVFTMVAPARWHTRHIIRVPSILEWINTCDINLD